MMFLKSKGRPRSPPQRHISLMVAVGFVHSGKSRSRDRRKAVGLDNPRSRKTVRPSNPLSASYKENLVQHELLMGQHTGSSSP
jgi:hypothetical protein